MTPRSRHALRGLALAALLVLSTVLAGCTGCSPQEVPTQVTLSLAAEEVRTLPILTSGATRVAGEELPDAHGRLEAVLDVAHEGSTNASLDFNDVTLQALKLGIRVGDAEVPVKLLKVEGGSSWTQRSANEWDGAAVSGSRLVLWWAVDRDRVKSPAELMLREGAAYTATVDFDWRHEDCQARASGHLRTPFEDFVQASANAKTFAAAGAPTVETKGASMVGLKADFRVTSGLDVDVKGVAARAVFLGPSATAAANGTVDGGLVATPGAGSLGGGADVGVDASVSPPGVGLVLFPSLGTSMTRVTPRDTLRVQSVETGSNATYAASGLLLPAGFAAKEGLYVVLVEISYQPKDATLGVTTDTFAFGVVKK